jgi:hypothetical protein
VDTVAVLVLVMEQLVVLVVALQVVVVLQKQVEAELLTKVMLVETDTTTLEHLTMGLVVAVVVQVE